MRSILFILALISFASCKGDKATKTEAAEAVVEAVSNTYSITPFSPSTAYDDVELTLNSYSGGTFDFGVVSKTYELGTQTPDTDAKMCANSAKGQHIHLILDTAPYAAKYEANFDYDVADGDHHLLAFVSRSYHESIKSPGAAVTKKVKVENKSIVASEDIDDPMLFYSRPKGTYVGSKDTEKIMLDFYLHNVTLGEAYRVVADINGEKHELDVWQPYYIEGLPMGKNSITLALIDADGNTVDVPNNPVTREFELKEDPAEGIEQ